MVEPKPNQPKRIVTWDQYWAGIQNLKQQLDTKGSGGLQFIGIPRGGVVLNALLMYHLKGEKQFHRWSLAKIEVHPYLILPRSTFVLVDDIIDSGHTMTNWIKLLQAALPKEEECCIKTVAMFKRHSCPIQPDIFYQQVEGNSWLIFPYEGE